MKKTISKTRKNTFWMFFKVVNLLLLIAAFATTKYYSSYFIDDYCLDNCSLEYVDGFLSPVIAGGEILTYILLFLLFNLFLLSSS